MIPQVFRIFKTPLRQICRLFFYGLRRFCPVCERTSRSFSSSGRIPRYDAKCKNCGALERHRLSWLYILDKTDLFGGKKRKMLHVAPEISLKPQFQKRLGDGYLAADLYASNAMIKMDITRIPYSSEVFDAIYCSHVLEHVIADREAIREFFRVLAPGGWAILNVPISRKESFEDISIVDPDERLRVFGQKNHVRRYGLDYAARLRDVGFDVQVIGVREVAGFYQAKRMGLTKASGVIFFCTKASHPTLR